MATLCGARCRVGPKQIADSANPLKLLRSNRCKRAVVPGRNRCYLHGGYSTGPRTAEGMQRMIERSTAGRLGGWKQKSRKASGKFTLQAKSARAAVTQRIMAAVEARQQRSL
jgi:hypothetical protein